MTDYDEIINDLEDLVSPDNFGIVQKAYEESFKFNYLPYGELIPEEQKKKNYIHALEFIVENQYLEC